MKEEGRKEDAKQKSEDESQENPPKPVRSFRDLIAWQKSIDMVDLVYAATGNFPKREMFGLTSQMRRAAVSVPANQAEGYCRRRLPDYLRLVDIARGSLGELQTHVVIAGRQGFLDSNRLARLEAVMDEVSRLLYGLAGSLSEKLR
jgi:four helix bundle protein